MILVRDLMRLITVDPVASFGPGSMFQVFASRYSDPPIRATKGGHLFCSDRNILGFITAPYLWQSFSLGEDIWAPLTSVEYVVNIVPEFEGGIAYNPWCYLNRLFLATDLGLDTSRRNLVASLVPAINDIPRVSTLSLPVCKRSTSGRRSWLRRGRGIWCLWWTWNWLRNGLAVIRTAHNS